MGMRFARASCVHVLLYLFCMLVRFYQCIVCVGMCVIEYYPTQMSKRLLPMELLRAMSPKPFLATK